jgi:hypothetical protein
MVEKVQSEKEGKRKRVAIGRGGVSLSYFCFGYDYLDFNQGDQMSL